MSTSLLDRTRQSDSAPTTGARTSILPVGNRADYLRSTDSSDFAALPDEVYVLLKTYLLSWFDRTYSSTIARFDPKLGTVGDFYYSGRAACFTIRADWHDTGTIYPNYTVYEPTKMQADSEHIVTQEPYIQALEEIRQLTELSKETIAGFIGISRQAPYLWESGKAQPSPANEERLYAVLHVLRLAAEHRKTVNEMRAWLHTPRGAEGKTPAALLEEGSLDEVRLLAVATPSDGVTAPPPWVRKPVPERYRTALERRRLPLPADDIDNLATDSTDQHDDVEME